MTVSLVNSALGSPEASPREWLALRTGLSKTGGPGGNPTHDWAISNRFLYALRYRPARTSKGQQFRFSDSVLPSLTSTW